MITKAKARPKARRKRRAVEIVLRPEMFAVGDDFGEWLISQGGRLRSDFEIDL